MAELEWHKKRIMDMPAEVFKEYVELCSQLEELISDWTPFTVERDGISVPTLFAWQMFPQPPVSFSPWRWRPGAVKNNWEVSHHGAIIKEFNQPELAAAWCMICRMKEELTK